MYLRHSGCFSGLVHDFFSSGRGQHRFPLSLSDSACARSGLQVKGILSLVSDLHQCDSFVHTSTAYSHTCRDLDTLLSRNSLEQKKNTKKNTRFPSSLARVDPGTTSLIFTRTPATDDIHPHRQRNGWLTHSLALPCGRPRSLADKDVTPETFLPPTYEPHKLLSLLDSASDEIAAAACPALIKGHPNTYTFTKCCAEGLVSEFRDESNVPTSVVRPSIITPAWREPYPGWCVAGGHEMSFSAFASDPHLLSAEHPSTRWQSVRRIHAPCATRFPVCCPTLLSPR